MYELHMSGIRLRIVSIDSNLQGIDEEGATATKLRIISMARVVLKVPVDVICSRGHFSYHIVSRHFCELRVRGIVCLIFQH